MPDEAPEKLGRYEITRAIGKGAMGVVYEGRDPKIGRRVAIKTCRADIMENTDLKNELLIRFEREFQAAGKLQHPYIVTIYDVGEDAGMPYIAMEYVEGHDLRQVIEQRASYAIPALVEIAARVAEGLHHAHAHGVIHRDVKPANVILPATGGGVKIADFGIARVEGSVLTLGGAVVGTPHYMSPEQFTGDPMDGRADLFAVGIILYEMLTGRKPFAGDSVSVLMHEVLRRAPAPPSQFNPAVPPDLDTVLLKALAKYPEERYPSGEALAAALRQAVKTAPAKAETLIGVVKPPVPAPPAPVPTTTGSESTLKPKGKRKDEFDSGHSVFWPLVAVVLFLVLAVVAIVLRIQLSTGTPEPALPTASGPAAAPAPAAAPPAPAKSP